MFFEVGRRVDRILGFSSFSKEEFAKVFSFIKGQIELKKSLSDRVITPSEALDMLIMIFFFISIPPV